MALSTDILIAGLYAYQGYADIVEFTEAAGQITVVPSTGTVFIAAGAIVGFGGRRRRPC